MIKLNTLKLIFKLRLINKKNTYKLNMIINYIGIRVWITPEMDLIINWAQTVDMAPVWSIKWVHTPC